MLTIEIIATLSLALGLLIYSMVRTMTQRREAQLPSRAEKRA